MNRQNNENNESNESNSTALNLESLNTEYKNLLIAYELSVSNYVNYLKEEVEQPCTNYTGDSKGISQDCYNDIWKKAGCGTGTIQPAPDANSSWAKGMTLNGLINDSWLWATMADDEHRTGCYGTDFDETKYNTSTEPDYNINNPDYNINSPVMTSIKGAAFWGTSSLSQNNSQTLEECKASCANTPGCTGATYNLTNGETKCMLRKGDANIATGSPDDYAIVPKGQQLLKIVQNINEKLTEVNEKIQKSTQAIETRFNSEAEKITTTNDDLINQYKNLVVERVKIQKILNEYQTLDEKHIEGNIYISQNYYSFILLMILVLLFVFLLYKFSIPSGQSTSTLVQNGGQLGTSVYYFVFCIFLLILLLTCYNKYKLL